MPLDEFVLVDTQEDLARALGDLAELPIVGVDVERADWDRYWRVAALIQVGGEGRVALVDPIALSDLSPLAGFLRARTTVFHAMENDLRPLETIGVVPGRVEDTSIAAAVLGLPTGLEALLADLLGVQLQADKQQMQRQDWEARPLPPQMLEYAAGDVTDLPALWRELATRLDAAGRIDWYRQELGALRARPPAEERRAWTKVKGAGRLDPTVRARVRTLWEARETLARSTDTAPSRILADRTLIQLAIEPAPSSRELVRRGVRRQAARRFGEDIMAALRAGDAADPEPVAGAGRRVTEDDREGAERLRMIRAERAGELGIQPGVLCPNRTLMTALLTDPSTPDELRSALGLRAWQWRQVGPEFCEALGLDGPVPDRGKPEVVARTASKES